MMIGRAFDGIGGLDWAFSQQYANTPLISVFQGFKKVLDAFNTIGDLDNWMTVLSAISSALTGYLKKFF